MIDELIAALRALALGNMSRREMEDLRQKLFLLMSQGRDAIDSLNSAGVATGLNADLLDNHHGDYYRDADKLDGQHGSYYTNADNIGAGTLNTERFSAYADLVAENRIGMTGTQVAPGDHTHNGLGNTNDIYMFIDGYLSAQQNVFSFVVPRDSEIESVYMHCRDTGTSSSTIIDVNRNGTTIFTTQSNRPTLAYDDSDKVASAVPDITALSEGDVLSVDIDQAAADAEGLNVVVRISNASQSLARKSQLYFSFYDLLETGTIPLRFYNRTGTARTIQQVHLYCTTPPQGADIIVDVLIDGTSIFAQDSHRPRIVDGNTGGYSTQINTQNWVHDSYLTCNLVQVGTSYPGSDLIVSVVYY